MGNVVLDISVSLDGYVAGPNDGIGRGLGDGGESLHYWVFGGEWSYESGPPIGRPGVDGQVLDEMLASLGAAVVGKRMYDIAGGWGDDPHWGAPCFVLTHTVRQERVAGETTFTFVTDGIESAVAQAKAAAGGKDVSIGGGASVAQQALRAGLVDQMQLHVAPVLLGAGRRLFDRLGPEQVRLERTRVIESPFATHLRFRVVK